MRDGSIPRVERAHDAFRSAQTEGTQVSAMPLRLSRNLVVRNLGIAAAVLVILAVLLALVATYAPRSVAPRV
jgi:hypothetical protein